MKIDVFNHVFPIEFFEAVDGLMPDAAVKRWKSLKTIFDMDARLRMLDEFDDYQQITITLLVVVMQLICGAVIACGIACFF